MDFLKSRINRISQFQLKRKFLNLIFGNLGSKNLKLKIESKIIQAMGLRNKIESESDSRTKKS